MLHSARILARNVGAKACHIPTASRRAALTAVCEAAGLTGNSAATDSSSARMREARSKKARARSLGFRWQVPRYDSIATRISTSSALGGGNADGSSFESTATDAPFKSRSYEAHSKLCRATQNGAGIVKRIVARLGPAGINMQQVQLSAPYRFVRCFEGGE